MNSNFDFTEKDGFFREFGTAPLLMRKNKCMICFNTLRKLHLWACDFSGKRMFELPVKKGIDGISQVADIQNVVQDVPVAVYELIPE